MPRSLNGWTVLTPGSSLLTTRQVPLNRRRLTMRREVIPLFLALAYDYDDWVRRIDKGAVIDEGGYSYRQARAADAWSNHASGTAVDLNWTQEGAVNSTWGRTFFAKPENQADIRHILNTYRVIQWGGAWNTFKDYMHWEIAPGHGLADVRSVIQLLGIDPRGVRHNDRNGHPLKFPRGAAA